MASSSLKLSFKEYDSNKDVYVSAKEAMTVLKGISADFTEDFVMAVFTGSGESSIAFTAFVKVLQVTKAFKGYDKDGSGRITVEETLATLLKEFSSIQEKNARALVTRFDRDNSGTLEYKEFIRFYLSMSKNKEKMEEVFKSADEDGSGTLSCDEIVPVLAEHLGLEPMFVYGMAEEFDANKDGQLDKKEFSNLFLAYYM